jgi:hypothetical protein
MNILFVVALILFAVAGLTPVFEWNLGRFDPISWGLAALAGGFLWPIGVRHR